MNASSFAQRKASRTRHYFRSVYGWQLRTCSACGGSGRYDNTGSPKCSSCQGSGRERYKAVPVPASKTESDRPCYRLGAVAYAKWHGSEGYQQGMSNRAARESIQRATKYGRNRLGDVPELLLSLKDYCAMRVRPSGVSQLLACREYPLQTAVEDWVAMRRQNRQQRRLLKG